MAGFNFKARAKEATTLSDLMKEREKIKVGELISDKTLQGTVTITDFDLVAGGRDGATYPIFIYKEDDSKFFSGGYILNKIVNDWIEGHEGDIHATREDFRNSGGVKIKLGRGETKSGNNITTVEILD